MRLLLVLLLLPVVLVAGLFLALTDDAPLLARKAQLGMEDLDRGRQVLQELSLSTLKEGELREVAVAESDLDKGLNYLVSKVAGGSASARIALGQIVMRASLPLPEMPRYLNLELAMAPEGKLLAPLELRIGSVTVPEALLIPLLQKALALSGEQERYTAALNMLEKADIQDRKLALRFTWNGESAEKILKARGSQGMDEAALEPYRQRLAASTETDFAILLGQAFALAQERSGQADPISENRAALTALSEKAMGAKLTTSLSSQTAGPGGGIKLAGRDDFSQHFALSAFIAATGGQEVSNLVGLYKEMKDAKGGTGFSFTDIAADRAGTRLGQALTASPEDARRLQAVLAGSRDSTAYLPRLLDLPEFMPQAQFNARFGGVGAPAYQRMMEEIEGRITRLGLYQPPRP